MCLSRKHSQIEGVELLWKSSATMPIKPRNVYGSIAVVPIDIPKGAQSNLMTSITYVIPFSDWSRRQLERFFSSIARRNAHK